MAALAAVFVGAFTLALEPSGRVGAHNTVDFDGAGETAPHIGIVGDSTLAGVRWWASYGDLRRYNFVLDAESCRRTIEESCWSREDYRPDSTVQALQRGSGRWGDVLVVMSGYNDSGYLFDDAVDAVVAEAREQAIGHVIWLTMRTHDVSYHDPQERGNADVYREDDRVLYEKAVENDGFLQIADWATYSHDRSDWFSYDGVHLTADGVSGLTTFIADSVDAVLAGEELNPSVPPWETLEEGDSGATVVDVQQALLDAGVATVGGADGVYGEQTSEAVAEFQEQRGLDVTGTVDAPTAVALGVHGPTDVGVEPAAAKPVRRSSEPGVRPWTVTASLATARRPTTPWLEVVAVGASVAAVAAMAWVLRRRRRSPTPGEWGSDGPEPVIVVDSCDDGLVVTANVPYDYEREELRIA